MAFNKYSSENFGKRVKEIAERTGQKVEQAADQSVKDLFTEIIEETPVGWPETWTYPPPRGYEPGNARANWNPSVNAPDTSVTDSKESATYKIKSIEGRVAGNVVYLTNNVPYIYELETGWSRLQKPNGWVERTVRSFDAKLTKTVRNLRK